MGKHSLNYDLYLFDEDGNYESKAEAEKAVANGHLEKRFDGTYYDPQIGVYYDYHGQKKA